VNVHVEEKGEFLVATCSESFLESGTARAFKEAVTSAVGERRRSLVIDLSAVREIDSSGLGALVAILKWIRRFGGSMRVCGLQPLVREVVELTMLHRILPLHATVEEAMEEEAERVHTGKGGTEGT
jgi:anti-sigma B factor antagonist